MIKSMDTSTDLEATGLEVTVPIEGAVAQFAAFADPTRLRILAALAASSCCVCDVQAVVDVAPNLLSYHLRVLREAGLVAGVRRGRWIDYRLQPDRGPGRRGALELAGLVPAEATARSAECSR